MHTLPAEKLCDAEFRRALGFRNGPILISRRKYHPEEVGQLSIAIPGEFTTAHLLLKIAFPTAGTKRVEIFSDIEG